MEPPCDVKALYEYKSEHEDDLNFSAGQVIHVSAIEDEEWLTGSYVDNDGTSQRGMFPKNFVELIEAPKAPARPTRAGHKQSVEDASHDETLSQNIPESVPMAESTVEDTKTRTAEPVSPQTIEQQSIKSPEPSSHVQSSEVPKGNALPEITADPVPAVSASSRDTELRTVEAPSTTSEPAPSSTEAENTPREVATAKPAKSNAFRDRIAAFNKQGAAPVAPKPMAKPNLAKKPFVAPPPSKDAFAASQLPSKTNSSPATNREDKPKPDSPAAVAAEHNDEKEDKPIVVGSLKDRIAALQAEQRQAAAKKAASAEKSEAPVEGSADTAQASSEPVDEDETESVHERDVQRPAATEEASIVRAPTIPVVPRTAEVESPRSPVILARQDTNRSMESVHAQHTGASGRSGQSSESAVPLSRTNTAPEVPKGLVEQDSMEVKREETEQQPPAQAEVLDSQERPEQSHDDEEEMDEEELRKQRLRERMAKMSGGMGIGMHMALGFGGPSTNRSTKTKPATQPTKPDAEQDSATRSAPVPMPGLSLPTDQHASSNLGEQERNTPATQIISNAEEKQQPTEEPSVNLASVPIPPRPLPTQSGMLEESEDDTELDNTGLEHSTARMSLDEPVITKDTEPQRAVPPPIPGGRPTTLAASVPAVPPSRDDPRLGQDQPSVDTSAATGLSSSHQGSSESNLQAVTAPAARAAPPPIPHAARASIDSIRSPPPIPATATTSRPSIDTATEPAGSPILSPGGSKRVSYFGSSPSYSNYRPSFDANTRVSTEQPRSSFDAVSRTSSVSVQAPSRPPRPSVPASRAPPPPVPVTSPPAPASMSSPPPPIPMSSPPPPRTAFPAAPPARAAPSLQPAHQGGPMGQAVEYPRSYERQPAQVDAIVSENERAGYEADDDDTDANSEHTQLAQKPEPAAQSSAPTAAQNAEKAKKKGIKGLFKRKDK